MPLIPGLGRNIRIQPQGDEQEFNSGDVNVDAGNDNEGKTFDDKGNVMTIEFDDGSISLTLDGSPLQNAEKTNRKNWFDNLVDDIDDLELGRIADDLMKGIHDDLESRKEWIDDRALGIKLLGLKIEIPGLGSVADGAPVEGMSKVRHPLLLEAVLRFQANARSEMLPTDGPVKIREDNNNATLDSDQLANDLENDLNHYLTSTAKEYYPDTDRMLFMLGFGGTSFKKIYFCPLRNRPVSESVDADDLIVNNSATDLSNAKRVTHRLYMKSSTVKRMQILGVYKDAELSTPKMIDFDAAQREKASQQGIILNVMNPDDRDREIYECYCEIDIRGFEHRRKGSETGLEIPYRVTIDASTRQILSIVRNYDEDTKELPVARPNFVKYTFVPGMGFYDIGLLHILGNTTNAITAAWREMLDSGMYANFPGFLYSDIGARQNTNIFRVPPGGGALIKTGGLPIQQAIMPLPYKDVGPGLMQLVENMAQTGMRIGGVSEAAVGEGKQDAPVGTTLAMIDQATKVLNSVHKRMHSAQAEEFELLVRCFKENPESFWQQNRRPARKWDQETFTRALGQVDLVPQADPNTASQTQRIMKIIALKQIQAQNPSLYDPIAIDTASLKAIGWSNPEQFMIPPSAQGAPPPELQKQMAEMQIKKQDSDTKLKLADGKLQLDQAKAALDQAKIQKEGLAAGSNSKPEEKSDHEKMLDTHAAAMSEQELIIKKKLADSKLMDSQLKAQQLAAEMKKDDMDNTVDQQEMIAKERIQMIDLAQNLAVHPESDNAVKNLLGNVIPTITGRTLPREPSSVPVHESEQENPNQKGKRP